MAWWMLLWGCGGPTMPGMPEAPLRWDALRTQLRLADDEWPSAPPDARVRLEGTPEKIGGSFVILDGSLRATREDCPAWPLPPLVSREGHWASARSLPPIDQRLELTLDPAQSLVHLERVIDSHRSGPSPGWWPTGWTLEATLDDVPIEPARRGDLVLWPPGGPLVMAGDGPLPLPNQLDEQGLRLHVADLVSDRRANTTGLSILQGPFHIEPGRGQRAHGSDLVVAGVRFPHHAARDGIRVLANDEADLAILDRLLALREGALLSWPRPLWVVPGARDAFVDGHLALSAGAWVDDTRLRQAVWVLHPMEASLRAAFQALEAASPPPGDPGCFGLRSRSDLDRSRLLAQVRLRDPEAHTARTWKELEARHPWLTSWLDAPAWPRLVPRIEGDTVRWVDAADTGLELYLPLMIDGERRAVPLDTPIPLVDGAPPPLAADARLPAHLPTHP